MGNVETTDKTKNDPPAKLGAAEKVKMLKREVRKQTAGYILAALGFVAGLAWNDAVKALIEYVFPSSQNGILVKFLYAVFITIFVVVAASSISRILMKDEEKS